MDHGARGVGPELWRLLSTGCHGGMVAEGCPYPRPTEAAHTHTAEQVSGCVRSRPPLLIAAHRQHRAVVAGPLRGCFG